MPDKQSTSERHSQHDQHVSVPARLGYTETLYDNNITSFKLESNIWVPENTPDLQYSGIY